MEININKCRNHLHIFIRITHTHAYTRIYYYIQLNEKKIKK